MSILTKKILSAAKSVYDFFFWKFFKNCFVNPYQKKISFFDVLVLQEILTELQKIFVDPSSENFVDPNQKSLPQQKVLIFFWNFQKTFCESLSTLRRRLQYLAAIKLAFIIKKMAPIYILLIVFCSKKIKLYFCWNVGEKIERYYWTHEKK